MIVKGRELQDRDGITAITATIPFSSRETPLDYLNEYCGSLIEMCIDMLWIYYRKYLLERLSCWDNLAAHVSSPPWPRSS